MCGIAGIIGGPAQKERVERMVEALSRRGPDDRGVWADPSGGAVLGHTRLSIIDLSTAGHQPMTHGDGRFWITFNGEIYNYKELRRDLEKDGARFASTSDTEVVLVAFACRGLECVRQLRGMFALAIWDRQERRMFLVRDRMGIKPLYWASISGGLVFASEVGGLLASACLDSVVDPNAIIDLLSVGSVRQPGSIIRNVRSLEPGSWMLVGSDGHFRTGRYWDVAEAARSSRGTHRQLSFVEAVSLTRERVEESCRYHLIADVPIGSFLSGGVDSAAITAVMSQHTKAKVKSFALGFEQTAEMKDELQAARLIADYISTDHTEIVLGAREVADSFDDLVDALDQPSHDGTNTYFVSRAARGAVKVVLSGVGGDEIFGGYPFFPIFQEAARRPAFWWDQLIQLTSNIWPNSWAYLATLRRLTVAERYARPRRILDDKSLLNSLTTQIGQYFQPGFLEAGISKSIDESLDSIVQTSLIECQNYLLNTLLRDTDVVSMANGLEVRPVLLDHPLVEHALLLSPTAKLRNGHLKAVLKDAVSDLVPPSVLTRPKKGFELPYGTWLRTTLRERLLHCLGNSYARRIFNRGFLEQHLKQLDNPANTKLHWTLLVMLTWMERSRVQLPE